MAGSIPEGPGRVFMSYRRDDTDFPASWLYERLTGHLGRDQVFKDVDSIELGDDFVQVINGAVGSCDVLLALIGDRWLAITDKDGNRRLDDPKDFVRLEIEAALRRRVRVIPILLGAAEMPTKEELPPSLSRLTRRQAMRLTPSRFEADIGRLLQVLDKTLLEEQAERAAKLEAQRESEARAARDAEARAAREATEREQARREADAGAVAEAPAPSRPSGPLQEADRDAATATPADGGRGSEPVRPDPRGGGRRILVLWSLVTVVVLGAIGAFLVRPWSSGGTPGPTTAPPPAVSSATSTSGSSAATAAAADGPDILAHRGGWEEYPLETEQAFKSAAVKGYAIETDVRWTSDNKAVLVHDDTATAEGLECDRPYAVSKTAWATLNKYCRSYVNKRDNRQYPIATYGHAMEALAAIPDTWVYVEVKTDQTAAQNRQFVDVIETNGMSSRTVVTSASLKRLAAIRTIAPDLRRMLFIAGKQVPASSLAKERLWAVAVQLQIASKSYVQELKRAGLKVVIWKVNEESTWVKARSLGADKVLTDNPNAYAAWAAK